MKSRLLAVAAGLAVVGAVVLGSSAPSVNLSAGQSVTIVCAGVLTSPTPAGQPTPTASNGSSTPSASPVPTASPTSLPSSTLYGSAINADTKSNVQATGKVAHRFVSPTTGTITSIRLQERGGPVYSGGNGGTYRIGIQGDANGVPSGSYIGTTATYAPGNSGTWDRFDVVTISAIVTKGDVLYVVVENTGSASNYFSVNEIYTYSHLTPRQPRFADSDYAVLSYNGSWKTQTETADMDVTYADGSHAGQSYIGMIGINGQAVYAATISGSSMVRETLGTPGFAVTTASVRVRRTSGNDPLAVSIISGGNVVAFGQVPASNVPQSAAGSDNGGSVWVTVTFPAVSFSGGELRLSTPSSSAYTAAPIRDGAESGFAPVLGFPDGIYQVSSNNGATWADPYSGGILDLQFYLH